MVGWFYKVFCKVFHYFTGALFKIQDVFVAQVCFDDLMLSRCVCCSRVSGVSDLLHFQKVPPPQAFGGCQ